MKVKLLKKLRKRIVLQERNNSYRVWDNRKCLGSVYNKTPWMSLKQAKVVRSIWILSNLPEKKPKKTLR
jgi:hypothetical protein